MPTIDAIIVAYNSGAWLQRSVDACLASVDVDKVIVCDNASTDGSVAKLVSDSRLQVIHMGGNLGFSRACNAGWRSSHAEQIAFVNPDCLVEATHLAALAQHLQDPQIGVISALLLNADGSPQSPSLRRDPTPYRSAVQLLGLAQWLPALAVNIPPPSSPGLVTVDACSGALMLMRRATLDVLQGFDEGYFLHCEDLDLCRRARAHGLRVVVDTRVRVVHHKGTSSQADSNQVALYKTDGMLRYFETFDAAKASAVTRWLVRTALQRRRDKLVRALQKPT